MEEEWLNLCEQGVPNFGFRKQNDFPDIDSLRNFSDQVYAVGSAYLKAIPADGLTARIQALLPDGNEHSVMIWQLLSHMLYHSAYHRSEIAIMLTNFGQSPGAIDFFGFRW